MDVVGLFIKRGESLFGGGVFGFRDYLLNTDVYSIYFWKNRDRCN
jgi:hypothetical protein